MGVYRQLVRRPALPFLFLVSCALISSPLWRTKQVGWWCWCILNFRFLGEKGQDPPLIRGLLQFYTFVMQDLNENLNNQKLEPLRVESLMPRLYQLEKGCGELCNLKKPVIVASGHFLGTVKAKVLNMFECHILRIPPWNILGELFVFVQSGKHFNITRWAFLRDQKFYQQGILLKHAKLPWI